MATESETAKKTQEIETAIKTLVIICNHISEEDIDEMLSSANREITLGPLIDPTAFQGDLFRKLYDVQKFLRALQTFKREVKGIGDFR